jgi:hypothetical protein
MQHLRDCLEELGNPSESSNRSSHNNSTPQQRVSDATTPLKTFETRILNLYNVSSVETINTN